ncbi:hypothetical protein Cni_G28942 [Canna indica]|uniref:Uncharacterized protein n=1 Tax=Canna indica TaxID=4628 RepID=A0AAQ3L4D3_9LILI|nr:hypothetical protein Cni_G28942 [Canna indica]
MAEYDNGEKRSNDVADEGGSGNPSGIEIDLNPGSPVEGERLYSVVRDFVTGVVSPPPPALLQRIKSSASKAAPRLREASKNSSRDLCLWTRRGSPLRALFVISVGTITLLALTGFLIFMCFLFAATLNAIIVSLLMSLAAAGGFLAIFFACLTAIYIGALSFAVFIISTTTISAIIAVMIAAGWIGLFWVVWFVIKKSVDLTKQSVTVTSSAISAYSTAWQAKRDTSKYED